MQDGPSLEIYEKLVVNCCPCTYVCSVSRPWKFGTNWINIRKTGPIKFFFKLSILVFKKKSLSDCLHIVQIYWSVVDIGKISIHWSKLLKQGYSSWKLQTTVRKFDGRHTDLPCSQIGHFCVTYVEGFVRKLWHRTQDMFPVIIRHSRLLAGNALWFCQNLFLFFFILPPPRFPDDNFWPPGRTAPEF